ncbi:hypothetical protein WI23_10480 [Burkholderia oklahomensis C6786]|nr:hypothetical protein WI23_10480 [Burkholderia oklahomensis C6786]KUY64147.1 hypothetical protein WI23_06775 [Burkholderia oklahomensis C6786]
MLADLFSLGTEAALSIVNQAIREDAGKQPGSTTRASHLVWMSTFQAVAVTGEPPYWTMTRAFARVSVAPSPILVGRRFCPRFS